MDNPYRLSDVALRIRSWLGRLTQWHAALYDLSQGHLAVGILNKKVTIKVEIAPRPVEPTKQASLRSAVEAVVGKDRLEESLGLILSRARQKWSDPDRPPTWPAGKTLLTASLLDESSMNSWEDQFFSSSIHCEACLACGMPESVVRPCRAVTFWLIMSLSFYFLGKESRDRSIEALLLLLHRPAQRVGSQAESSLFTRKSLPLCSSATGERTGQREITWSVEGQAGKCAQQVRRLTSEQRLLPRVRSWLCSSQTYSRQIYEPDGYSFEVEREFPALEQ